MAQQPSQPAWQKVSPRFAEITQEFLFGDIWERPGLSKRDRSLIVVATLCVLYRSDQLRGHIGRALENGLSQEELGEAFLHLAFYGGWPVAVNAMRIAAEVFEDQQA